MGDFQCSWATKVGWGSKGVNVARNQGSKAGVMPFATGCNGLICYLPLKPESKDQMKRMIDRSFFCRPHEKSSVQITVLSMTNLYMHPEESGAGVLYVQ